MRMKLGIINLLKPPGPTSHDMVNWIRRQLKIRQVGHLGTLDPGAAGVLPICVGPATRLAEYMSDWNKKYRVEMLLGLETDTQDFFGRIVKKRKIYSLTEEQITKKLEQMQGSQEQIPPMVSAVRCQGRKLYELAREGKTVYRKPRHITIYDLRVLRIKLNRPYPQVLFEAEVSKGTYIRTLCADLGDKLGCGGCMAFLVRTKCGPFRLEQAWTPEEIQTALQKGDHSFILSPEIGLVGWPVWKITSDAVNRLAHGASLSDTHFQSTGVLDLKPGTMGCLLMPEGQIVAIGCIKENGNKRYCQPVKVLFTPNLNVS